MSDRDEQGEIGTLSIIKGLKCYGHDIGRSWDFLDDTVWQSFIRSIRSRNGCWLGLWNFVEDLRLRVRGRRTKDQIVKDRYVFELQHGIIRSIGYQLPRTEGDMPRRIPPDAWKGEINFERDELRGAGFEFVVVRILIPMWSRLIRRSEVEPVPLSLTEIALEFDAELDENRSGTISDLSSADMTLIAYRALEPDVEIPLDHFIPKINQMRRQIFQERVKKDLADSTVYEHLRGVHKKD